MNLLPLLLLVFGMLVALGVGAMVVCIATQDQPRLRRDPILVLSLGLGAGLVLTSGVGFVALLAGDGATRALLSWEVLLLLAVLALAVPRLRWADFMIRGNAPPIEPRGVPVPARTALPLALRLGMVAAGGAVAVQVLSLLTRLWARPWGEFDAVSIWNVRARFFYLAPAHWRDAFAAAAHADYPLLLPLSVSRLWAYAGRTDSYGPRLLALAIDLATIGLLYGALRHLRGRWAAVLGVFTLIALPIFTEVAAIQYADAPLAFFILATCCCVALAGAMESQADLGSGGAEHARAMLVLAGMMAGGAAWTKNEGLVFALAMLLAVGLIGAKSGGNGGSAAKLESRWSRVARFMWGLAPFLVLVAIVKVVSHTPTDLFAKQTIDGLIARIVDVSRYRVISHELWDWLISVHTMIVVPLLLVYVPLAGMNRDAGLRRAAARVGTALAVLAISYCVVYLLTPFDLHWQISTTLIRLFIHLWSAFVFLVFLSVRTPGEIVRKGEQGLVD